uniref:Uncharacterized protein n=1 Tax=Timema tahoe TaxID=61484 RepID=A0A7R9NYE9_9NEOP|nr:unnamed protein product [Timema tahoe]
MTPPTVSFITPNSISLVVYEALVSATVQVLQVRVCSVVHAIAYPQFVVYNAAFSQGRQLNDSDNTFHPYSQGAHFIRDIQGPLARGQADTLASPPLDGY